MSDKKDFEAMQKVEVTDADIENVLNILENFGASEEGRLKVDVSDQIAEATTKKRTHYGRCDIGSPFAKGTPFDCDDAGDNGGC